MLLVALVGVLADRPRGRASRASGASRNSRALLVEAGRRLLRERLGEIRGRTPRQRVAETMRKLNGAGLGLDVSEQPVRTVIRSCSCPIASVVARRPEACALFAGVLGELLDADVSESCEKGESARCRFEVRD